MGSSHSSSVVPDWPTQCGVPTSMSPSPSPYLTEVLQQLEKHKPVGQPQAMNFDIGKQRSGGLDLRGVQIMMSALEKQFSKSGIFDFGPVQEWANSELSASLQVHEDSPASSPPVQGVSRGAPKNLPAVEELTDAKVDDQDQQGNWWSPCPARQHGAVDVDLPKINLPNGVTSKFYEKLSTSFDDCPICYLHIARVSNDTFNFFVAYATLHQRGRGRNLNFQVAMQLVSAMAKENLIYKQGDQVVVALQDVVPHHKYRGLPTPSAAASQKSGCMAAFAS